MSSIVQGSTHSPWHSYLQEAKCEALRMLREPAFCLPVIGFPVLFYLLFGVLLDKGEGKAAPYLLETYGAFGVIGAGLFGFLINPPLSLYYMQGLNLTPTHGHTALFGVYGMLGIGLMLFCLRGLKPDVVWSDKLLATAFWSLNIGLAGMALFTLLPLGILQLIAALDHGYWYARSAEFMQQPIVEMLVWMRVPGDTIFSIGAVALAWFVLRLWIAPRREAALDDQAVTAKD